MVIADRNLRAVWCQGDIQKTYMGCHGVCVSAWAFIPSFSLSSLRSGSLPTSVSCYLPAVQASSHHTIEHVDNFFLSSPFPLRSRHVKGRNGRWMRLRRAANAVFRGPTFGPCSAYKTQNRTRHYTQATAHQFFPSAHQRSPLLADLLSHFALCSPAITVCICTPLRMISDSFSVYLDD